MTSTKTKAGIDELLSAVNTAVDCHREWSPTEIDAHLSEIQRMAANLPALHRIAVSGWVSARFLAIAHNAASTEKRGDEMLRELGDEE